jgi:hypothetical protein
MEFLIWYAVMWFAAVVLLLWIIGSIEGKMDEE